ncbi:MAG: DNA primase [Anaerolineae bacterium]|nr:DNA primase [Anaerolineae bacterium]
MSVIDEIKSRIDIVDLVSETVKLRRSGKSFTGFCPFHSNTRTPAFVVFPDSGTWRCFGQCNEGGDIFRFIMKKEGWDFSQALKYLAQRAGVPLESPSPEKTEADEYNERLRTLLEEAVTFYHHQLMHTPAGKAALDYLQQRGLSETSIESFGLGYAPESWDSLIRFLASKSYSTEDMLAAGLVSERQEAGGVYDRFRNRIMFPIREMNGKMCGFGARRLNPADEPKFLNSPQTALFDKGRLLYGLDLARKPIREREQAVIVEGYLDVIALHQAGFRNTVSPMGTALSEDQFRLLKRFTRRIILALDADAAGQHATLRGLELARQALDHSNELIFDARGLLRQEARLNADLRVTTLPEGLDPDEIALRDPKEWESILANAKPIVLHVMEVSIAGRDLEDPKTKSEIVQRIIPLINDVPSAVERDTYRQRLARLLKLDERTLIEGTGYQPRSRPGRGIARPTQISQAIEAHSKAETLPHALEAHCLSLLIRNPEALYQLDRALQAAGLSRLGVQDFEYSDHQMLARLIQESLEQEDLAPNEYLETRLPDTLRALVDELKQQPIHRALKDKALVEDLTRSMLRLRLVRTEAGLQQVRMLQQDLQEQGETSPEAYQGIIAQYTITKSRLNRALAQPFRLD